MLYAQVCDVCKLYMKNFLLKCQEQEQDKESRNNYNLVQYWIYT